MGVAIEGVRRAKAQCAAKAQSSMNFVLHKRSRTLNQRLLTKSRSLTENRQPMGPLCEASSVLEGSSAKLAWQV